MSLVNCTSKSLEGLDASQLVGLVNACMESLRKPYCSRASLVKFLEDSSWRLDEADSPPEHPPTPSTELEAVETTNTQQPLPIPAKLRPTTVTHDWHCLLLHLCNVLSLLAGENYDIVVELLCHWTTGDVQPEVKSAFRAHMRDLFARNMREQEEQAQRLRSRDGDGAGD
jgi:hypothetical protein